MENIKTISGFEAEKVTRTGYVAFKITRRMPDGSFKGYHAFKNEFGVFGEKFNYGINKYGYWEHSESLSQKMVSKVISIVEK